MAIFCNLVVLSFFNFTLQFEHLLAMIVFALIPDIDTPGSFIGKVFFFISNRINLAFGHRGFIHSLHFLLIIIALSSFVFFLFPPTMYVFP
ncbi:MAG TPA: hypothetical protein DDY71_14825 [Spirochaetia bacterium]|nr:hypothetical protein [Spirochaetia bacterium]HBI38912.1 hypothetical protein [Spirochaetia bacterium]